MRYGPSRSPVANTALAVPADRLNAGCESDFVEKLGLNLGAGRDSSSMGTGSGDPR